jgi:hypothetical protein
MVNALTEFEFQSDVPSFQKALMRRSTLSECSEQRNVNDDCSTSGMLYNLGIADHPIECTLSSKCNILTREDSPSFGDSDYELDSMTTSSSCEDTSESQNSIKSTMSLNDESQV